MAAGEGSAVDASQVENVINEVSNTPIEIPNADSKNLFAIHVDNRSNADPTFVKLWNDPTVTYATEEPDLKFKIPGGKQGSTRIRFSAASTSPITVNSEKWWVAASKSSAVAGAAPGILVNVRITRDA